MASAKLSCPVGAGLHEGGVRGTQGATSVPFTRANAPRSIGFKVQGPETENLTLGEEGRTFLAPYCVGDEAKGA